MLCDGVVDVRGFSQEGTLSNGKSVSTSDCSL
jgi:hypothetical protein